MALPPLSHPACMCWRACMRLGVCYAPSCLQHIFSSAHARWGHKEPGGKDSPLLHPSWFFTKHCAFRIFATDCIGVSSRHIVGLNQAGWLPTCAVPTTVKRPTAHSHVSEDGEVVQGAPAGTRSDRASLALQLHLSWRSCCLSDIPLSAQSPAQARILMTCRNPRHRI